MMGHREKLAGDGEDALTRAKQFYHFKAGTRAWIKRRYGKRMRKVAKVALDAICKLNHEF